MTRAIQHYLQCLAVGLAAAITPIAHATSLQPPAQQALPQTASLLQANQQEQTQTFLRLLQERAQAGDPDAIKLINQAQKNQGNLNLTTEEVKAWIEKWTADQAREKDQGQDKKPEPGNAPNNPPAGAGLSKDAINKLSDPKTRALFEKMLYQQVKAGDRQATQIYDRAIESGGYLGLTATRMKEHLKVWHGHTLNLQDYAIKFDPVFILGPTKTITYSTRNMGKLMLAQTTVNGVEGLFVIDTGASHTIISKAFAKKLKLTDQTRPFEAEGNLADSKQKVTRLKTLAAGDVQFLDFDAIIVSLKHLKGVSKKPIAGIIGSNLLSTNPYALRWRDAKLVFGKLKPEQLRHMIAVPMTVDHMRPGLKLDINDEKDVPFLIDSGATQSILLKKFYKGKVTKRKGVVDLDINEKQKRGTKQYGKPKTIAVAGKRLKPVTMHLSTSKSVSLLGANFLRLYDMFVDTGQKKIYFVKSGSKHIKHEQSTAQPKPKTKSRK